MDIPGPGDYPIPSFVNPKHGKRFSFYPRIPEVTKVRAPPPASYNAQYSQVETTKTPSFGKGERSKFATIGGLSPAQYKIKTKFEVIAEYSKRKKMLYENLSKMRNFKPHKRAISVTGNRSRLNETIS